MPKLIFATTNPQKVLLAQGVCGPLGIELVPSSGLKITEIQSEHSDLIARHKASEAFRILKRPLVVTDDSWSIPALGGFPGPYMSSINKWFGAEDWLRLTHGLADRRVVLRQIVVYQDVGEQKLFAADIEGVLLTKPRGSSPHTNMCLISMDDGRTSIAEGFSRGLSPLSGQPTAWHIFAEWFEQQKSVQPKSKTTSKQRRNLV